MKFQKFILTMTTLLITGSAVAAGFDSRNKPVFTPGSTEEVQIKADLPKGTSALQFTVTLPESFELVSETPILNVQLTSKSHKEENGVYNFVLYTEDNSAIVTDSDWLFGLSLKAKDSAGKGVYVLNFTNIIAAVASGSETRIADCDVDLTVKIPVSQVKVSPSTLDLRAGDSAILKAEIIPADATDGKVIWTSSDRNIATVDADGVVTAMKAGSATITATTSDGTNLSAVCKVTVMPSLATGVTLSQSELNLTVRETFTLAASVIPVDAEQKVSWRSDMPDVATVDKDGNVSAISPGRAVITAVTADGTNLTASCLVTVEPVKAESVTLSVTSWFGKVGESFTLTATVLPENTTDKTLIWSSSNTDVATVDANGYVMALSLGNAVITASCGNVSAKCDVTVISTPVESLTVSPENWDGIEGENFTIIATVLPEDATDKSLSWSSSDPEIVTVDQDGNVLVLKDGYCVISVVTLDGSDLSAECIVTSRSGIEEIFAAPDVMVDIYSISGKLLNHRCTLDDVKHLNPGLYIIRCGGVSKTILLH